METFIVTLYGSDGQVIACETYEFELLSEAFDQFLTDHHGTAPGEKMLIEQVSK